ncbi:N-6 DNA methylase, partial [uncultured Anaerovibrio sp.]
DKFAHLATFEEIKENDYNLNIPRYVDTSEPEPEIDLDAVTADMESIDADIKNTSSELLGMMKDLTFSTPEIEQSMSKLIKALEV